jgi:hypothetical protein
MRKRTLVSAGVKKINEKLSIYHFFLPQNVVVIGQTNQTNIPNEETCQTIANKVHKETSNR